jgi:chromosome segregation ATPase
MIEWHDALKALRGEQKKLEVDNRGDKDMLANMENRQEMQRADVERMRQRAVIKRKIEILEFLRPIVEYKDGHAALEVLKANKAQLQQEHEQLKADLEPALRALNVKESYIEQLNTVKTHRKDSVERASRLATARGTQIDEFDSKIKDLAGQIEAERKTGVTHKKEAANAQQNIKMLQRRLEEEPVEFDPDVFNESLVRILYNLIYTKKALTMIIESETT